jgi:hypothetical protein
MRGIQVIDPLSFPQWDRLVLSCPDYSFFHSSVWARVLQDTYHYRPAYFVRLGDARLIDLVPVMEVDSFLTGRRGVSLPFTDYSDVIIADGDSFKDILGYICQYGRSHGWKSLELRGGRGLPAACAISCYNYRHILSLSRRPEEVFSGFGKSTRRNIREAVKKGVRVEICNTFDSVLAFERLNCITRKRHGLPPQPFRFFEEVFEHIISKNSGFVILASYKDMVIAGAVFFQFGEKAVWKYNGSIRNFFRLRGNNLILWEAIKWHCENGYKSICFGRTEPANEGLRKFKAEWGTREEKERYCKYDFEKNEFVSKSWEMAGIYRKVLRRMPFPLLNLIGSSLYRHMG